MKQIQLLLTENVENLGIVGDVVNVRPGYARNYLLPRGLAQPPSEGAIARLAERRAQVEAEMKAKREAQEAMIGKLDEFEVTIERATNDQGILFGGVSQHDIAEALRAAGFEVEDRHVRVGEQIKRVDSYMIPIVVDNELKTEIKLWVVSDRPLELDQEEEAEEEGEQQEEAAETADAGDAETEQTPSS